MVMCAGITWCWRSELKQNKTAALLRGGLDNVVL
jgi:hypothetical protein